jgi:hypothetical protein
MQRRKGLVAFAALSAFLLCGATSPTTCNSTQRIGPSTAEVVGIGVAVVGGIAVGTIVLVEVHKSHHRIKGCVTAGPDGLEVHNDGDQKVYALTGITTGVKVGDIVKLNGNKEKHQKDSAGDEDFMIQKISRDYGPCQALPAPPASNATP